MRRLLLLACALFLAAADQPSAPHVRVRRVYSVPPPLEAPATPANPATATSGAPGVGADFDAAAACSTECARSRYFCAAGDVPDSCPSAWSRCVAACSWPDPIGGSGAANP